MARIRSLAGRVGLAGALLVIAGGCSTREPSPEVIGHLRTNAHLVTVYAADAGPRFDVATLGGAVEARDLNEADLEGRFPGIAEAYRSSVAERDASSPPPLDIRLRIHAID